MRELLDLMARPCPICDLAYVEHDLEGLAACMEEIVEADAPVLEPCRRPTDAVQPRPRFL